VSLRVVSVNAGATLQDGGRPGYRKFGVPIAGAFDKGSLVLGNALLGNPPATAALEFTLMGGVFEADDTHVCVVYGAECEVAINGAEQPAATSFLLSPGDRLSIGSMTAGVRAYLFVAGGFVCETILGSVSGATVAKGSALEVGARPGPGRLPPVGSALPKPNSLKDRAIRVVPAPQTEEFGRSELAGREFEVSNYSNRAGIRLDGAPLTPQTDRLSEPMCFGTIQIANNGLPTIIGPDGPTVGGYPKIACTAEVDLDRLAQLAPGDEVSFAWVDVAEARELRRADTDVLERIIRDLA
jgi:biotin-dependent carboxylase-like uncharacterized protein